VGRLAASLACQLGEIRGGLVPFPQAGPDCRPHFAAAAVVRPCRQPAVELNLADAALVQQGLARLPHGDYVAVAAAGQPCAVGAEGRTIDVAGFLG
jgi:hypothetical protein